MQYAFLAWRYYHYHYYQFYYYSIVTCKKKPLVTRVHPPGICHIGSSIFSFNIFFRDLQLESLILVLRTQCSTGCCALEIGNCQPQYRNEQHKLTQQHLIWSTTCLNIVHMGWKLKGEITMYKIKKGTKTNYKGSKIKRKTKTKYNRLKLASDPVLKG